MLGILRINFILVEYQSLIGIKLAEDVQQLQRKSF